MLTPTLVRQEVEFITRIRKMKEKNISPITPKGKMKAKNKQFKILLIDNDSSEATRLKGVFQKAKNMIVEWFHFARLSEALKWLKSNKADVIWVGLWLPDGFGKDNILALQAFAPDAPLLVLSDKEDEMLAADLVEDGAESFMIRGFTNPREAARMIYLAIKQQKLIWF